MHPETQIVLAGEHLDMRWQVEVSGEEDALFSMLRVRRQGHSILMSGFGGPALYPNELVNDWRGREDGSPYFVMARAAVDVVAIIAETRQGDEVLLASSELVMAGVRHHAGGLPVGQEPGLLRVLSRSRGWLDTRAGMPDVGTVGRSAWFPHTF